MTRRIALALIAIAASVFLTATTARAQTPPIEPTPRELVLPTATPEPTSTPLPAPPRESPQTPPQTQLEPTTAVTTEPVIAPSVPAKPLPTATPAFVRDPEAPVEPRPDLPVAVPDAPQVLKDVVSQIEIRFKQMPRMIQAVGPYIETNWLPLIIALVAGFFVLSMVRLIIAFRTQREEVLGTGLWSAADKKYAALVLLDRPNGASLLMGELIADALRKPAALEPAPMPRAGAQPAPYMMLNTTDGSRSYILTTSPRALNGSNAFGRVSQTRRIGNPESFAFTKANALWNFVREQSNLPVGELPKGAPWFLVVTRNSKKQRAADTAPIAASQRQSV